MIKRLLVANRGEIAVRVMATAAVLGLETVAVYPADDAACAHVSRAGAAAILAQGKVRYALHVGEAEQEARELGAALVGG